MKIKGKKYNRRNAGDFYELGQSEKAAMRDGSGNRSKQKRGMVIIENGWLSDYYSE